MKALSSLIGRIEVLLCHFWSDLGPRVVTREFDVGEKRPLEVIKLDVSLRAPAMSRSEPGQKTRQQADCVHELAGDLKANTGSGSALRINHVGKVEGV